MTSSLQIGNVNFFLIGVMSLFQLQNFSQFTRDDKLILCPEIILITLHYCIQSPLEKYIIIYEFENIKLFIPTVFLSDKQTFL